jgi:hypothetical protein
VAGRLDEGDMVRRTQGYLRARTPLMTLLMVAILGAAIIGVAFSRTGQRPARQCGRTITGGKLRSAFPVRGAGSAFLT